MSENIGKIVQVIGAVVDVAFRRSFAKYSDRRNQNPNSDALI